MTDGTGARKRIGFLSFGHWPPIAGSQVRTVLVRFRCTPWCVCSAVASEQEVGQHEADPEHRMPTAVQAAEVVAARWQTTARAHGHPPQFVDQLGASSIRHLGKRVTTRLVADHN